MDQSHKLCCKWTFSSRALLCQLTLVIVHIILMISKWHSSSELLIKSDRK